MEPSRSKRQRLMMSSSYSYVSPPRPDLPATFESLNDDTLGLILQFVGSKSYATYAGINKHCKEIYLNTKGMTKETFLYGYGPLSVIKEEAKKVRREIVTEEDYNLVNPVGIGVVYHNRNDVLDWAIQEKNKDVLGGICDVAGREGRIDILNEVWSNVNDDTYDKEDIFCCADKCASIRGKLEVLKWLDLKGSDICQYECAEAAAYHGQLHILQWLQENKVLDLSDIIYQDAVCGDHFHVIKWVREQNIPWYEYTFGYAALTGNLEVLQWLHDEGCPWPTDSYYRVCENDIKPEVLNWCRSNGYGDRLLS